MTPKSTSTQGKRNAAVRPSQGSGRGSDGSSPSGEDNFLVAAIGASAGGIEACSELFRNLPPDTGMAFVLIQHLDPNHQSILTELLARETKMSVEEVTDGLHLECNHVYVIPPNASMSVVDHTLRIGPREEVRRVHMPIDHFMRALAQQQGVRAIGVILSGSGTDGTLGMAEIQAQGGVTFAQDEASAKFNSMPRSAVGAGCVDYILPPKGIARELARISRHPLIAKSVPEVVEIEPEDGTDLHSMFQLLRRATGVDFGHYRQTTILRRIQRRMVVHKIDKLNDYVKYIQTNSAEIKALYQDMLINVTSFFRNPSVFDAIKSEVFPAIMQNRPPDSSIRIWTPGCASGEETYSVAISLLEFLGEKATEISIQFFGTDVSELSIAKARTGAYPENIQADVSAERLRRFFNKTEGGYRISKSIRDMCIFAQHNLINDPPFSQMDLICCRNLLIYLEPPLQSKVISLFHYAARPNGFLVLGSSESPGTVTNLFATQDRTHKIFSRKAAARPMVTFSLNRQAERPEFPSLRLPSKQAETHWNYVEAQKEFDRRLLSHYSPPAVFINDDFEIVHTRGDVGRYLKLAPGRASFGILKMAREGLLFDLRSALNRAKKENVPVRKPKVQIKTGNGDGSRSHDSLRQVALEVVPVRMGNLKELFFMVLFHEEPLGLPAPKGRGGSPERRAQQSAHLAAARVAKLEEELAASREYLQSVIETLEATNEELQSANEEILSSNEELQSTNEEMETAKEELQSANEELSTVNDELRSRNLEITQANNDLINLFGSIDIAVLIVGSDLAIRRFTPHAEKVLGLIPSDIGRPFLNINPSIEVPDFQQLVLQVISNPRPLERHFTDKRGESFHMRILPYRTSEGKIEGAVVTILPTSSK